MSVFGLWAPPIVSSIVNSLDLFLMVFNMDIRSLFPVTVADVTKYLDIASLSPHCHGLENNKHCRVEQSRSQDCVWKNLLDSHGPGISRYLVQ